MQKGCGNEELANPGPIMRSSPKPGKPSLKPLSKLQGPLSTPPRSFGPARRLRETIAQNVEYMFPMKSWMESTRSTSGTTILRKQQRVPGNTICASLVNGAIMLLGRMVYDFASQLYSATLQM